MLFIDKFRGDPPDSDPIDPGALGSGIHQLPQIWTLIMDIIHMSMFSGSYTYVVYFLSLSCYKNPL